MHKEAISDSIFIGVAKGRGYRGQNPPIGPNVLVIFTKTPRKRRSGAYPQRFCTLKTPSFDIFWPQPPPLLAISSYAPVMFHDSMMRYLHWLFGPHLKTNMKLSGDLDATYTHKDARQCSDIKKLDRTFFVLLPVRIVSTIEDCRIFIRGKQNQYLMMLSAFSPPFRNILSEVEPK